MGLGLRVGLLWLVLAGSAPGAAWAQAVDPAQGALWDLGVIYPDTAAAQREIAAVEVALPALARFKGHLGDSAAMLRAGLDARSALARRVARLQGYTLLKVSEDVRVSSSHALQTSTGALSAKLQAASAFYDPEIVAIGSARLAAYEAEETALAKHRRTLDLVGRRAGHVLTPEVEAAVAASAALRQAPADTRDTFVDGEMPWPTLSVHGVTTRLDQGTMRGFLRGPDRGVRQAVFEARAATLGQFRNTQAALLQAYVGGAAYEAKLRHYPSSAAFLLADDAMPPEAFAAMSTAAEAEQPVLDRYLGLRARALGVDKIHSYDLAVPLSSITKVYALSDAEAVVLEAVAPLGPDYVARLASGFRQQRMNAVASPGKFPGAMTVSFDGKAPPMVMITYTGNDRSVSILAHEWGHAIQMELAQEAQPFETATASVFVADTPSLLNEFLLDDYLIDHASTPDEKIAALSLAVETLRRTYYQVLPMMRVEMAERAAADAGEPLTAERLSRITCDELRRFNGADHGASVVDPGACVEWTVSQEPYEDLYFYKYLNAVSAAAVFADAIERGAPGALDRYFALLRAGGSDDPYLLLKRAGFDARNPAAYAAIGRRFEHDVDGLEAELRSAGRLDPSPKGEARPTGSAP